MAFVDAYNTRTGKKLPYLVPEHHFDHPILGRNISRLPSQKAGQDETGDDTGPVFVDGLDRDASTEVPDFITITETPAAGDQDKE